MPRYIIEKPVYLRIPITASDIDTAIAQADGIVDAAAKLINFALPDEDASPDVYECVDGGLVLRSEDGPEPLGLACDD